MGKAETVNDYPARLGLRSYSWGDLGPSTEFFACVEVSLDLDEMLSIMGESLRVHRFYSAGLPDVVITEIWNNLDAVLVHINPVVQKLLVFAPLLADDVRGLKDDYDQLLTHLGEALVAYTISGNPPSTVATDSVHKIISGLSSISDRLEHSLDTHRVWQRQQHIEMGMLPRPAPNGQ